MFQRARNEKLSEKMKNVKKKKNPKNHCFAAFSSKNMPKQVSKIQVHKLKAVVDNWTRKCKIYFINDLSNIITNYAFWLSYDPDFTTSKVILTSDNSAKFTNKHELEDTSVIDLLLDLTNQFHKNEDEYILYHL